ncbi:MAG: rhomboid family intramembrane serine protease [Desulfurococcaceae archaeon]
MAILPGEGVRGRYKPVITSLLIVMNVLVYLYTSIGSEIPLLQSSMESVLTYGFKPVYLFSNPLEAFTRVFTSMFIHADLFHIFFNMYFLWLFGSRIEGFLGPKKILALYFLSGFSAVLFHVAFIPVGGYDALTVPAVGASGAISGVLGTYLLMLPYTKFVMCTFYLLIPFCFRLPASAFLVIWFAEQVIYGYMKLGGVAYFAHIGGFVMGLALAPLLVRGITRRPRHLDYVYRYFAELYGIQLTRPRGIGTGTKIVLALLLVGVIAGFLYGAYTAYKYTGSTLYALDITVGATTNGVQNDQVLLGVIDDEVVIMGPQIYDSSYPYALVRVLLNRLGPVLHNTSYLNSVILRSYYSYTVPVNNIPVKVELNVDRAEYDGRGVAVYMEGTMETAIVLITRGGARLENVELSFVISAHTVNLVLFTALSMIAMAICVFGISAVIRGEEVAVFSQSSLPEIFPYI